MPPRTPCNGRARGGREGEVPVTLDPEQSAPLREKLLTELGNITSADLAVNLDTSAKLVEDAFEQRLSELPPADAAAPSNDESSVTQIAGPQVIATTEGPDAGQAKGIDKSILTVAAPRRYRNRSTDAAGVSRLRPQAIRSPPPWVHPAPRAWPQGER